MREVRLSLSGTGTNVELRVPAKDPAGHASRRWPATSDWRSVAKQSQAGATATLTAGEPVTTRYVLVYLTSLPKEGEGLPGRYLRGRGAVVTEGMDPYPESSPPYPPAADPARGTTP